MPLLGGPQLGVPVLGVLAASVLAAPVLVACDGSGSPSAGPSSEERDPVTRLTPTESKEVLARVGERVITLGEYAHTLARMAPFERLRYQTAERQKQLLEEMI
ncbi:MAG TPA: hypothetical protein VLC09_06280, partial [Polyangiaceae bacterium]|nr:hypothetical protein [Polyangiaceae bacterium]